MVSSPRQLIATERTEPRTSIPQSVTGYDVEPSTVLSYIKGDQLRGGTWGQSLFWDSYMVGAGFLKGHELMNSLPRCVHRFLKYSTSKDTVLTGET